MKKQAFTLVELLAIILLLSIILVIVTPQILNSINQAKEKALADQVIEITSAAQNWSADNTKLLPVANESTTITLGAIRSGGYISNTIINAVTGLNIPNRTKIIITVVNGSYHYEVRIDESSDITIVNTVSEALNYRGDGYLVYEGTNSITNTSTTPTTTPQTGDTLICGQYEYRFNEYCDDGSWVIDTTQDGWGMRLTSAALDDTTIDTKMLIKINNKNIVTMKMLFGNSVATSIDLSSFDTSNVVNMRLMFTTCSNLTDLDVSSFDTSNVTSMEYMFCMCTHLTNISLGSLDTSSVTNMASMFFGCRALTSLNLTRFNTSNVTDMWSMFYNCLALTSVDVTHFDTSKVTNMDGIFAGCAALTNLDVTHFDTSNVIYMGNMFNGCSALTSLNLTSFDTTKATNMSYMFNNCSLLTSITAKTSKWVIGTSTVTTDMFTNCGTSSVTLS